MLHTTDRHSYGLVDDFHFYKNGESTHSTIREATHEMPFQTKEATHSFQRCAIVHLHVILQVVY